MRPPALQKLLPIAKTARYKIERLANIEGGPSDLTGYCGVAARYIELQAAKADIEVEFVAGYFNGYIRPLDEYSLASGHCWVEFDGYIVDITATQFRNVRTKVCRDFNRKVYVSRSTNPHYEKELAGDDARRFVSAWYCEPLDEIIEKANRV